jgi:hypothetical protein
LGLCHLKMSEPQGKIAIQQKKTPIDYLDESFIRSLAQRYQVSAYTMLLRLAQGNLNSPV